MMNLIFNNLHEDTELRFLSTVAQTPMSRIKSSPLAGQESMILVLAEMQMQRLKKRKKEDGRQFNVVFRKKLKRLLQEFGDLMSYSK